MDLEAVDPRSISIIALGWNQRWVDLEDNVVEGGAKVSSVDGRMAGGFRIVDIFAFRAV